MTDAATTAAACAATGAIAAPFCSILGFDPALLAGGLVGGFAGCIIVQTLIPAKKNMGARQIVPFVVGSVMFSTVLTPLIASMVIVRVGLPVPDGLTRVGIGCVLAAFAQPIVVIGKTRLAKSKIVQLLLSIGSKETDNA